MIAWIAGQPLVLKIVLAGLGTLLLLFSLWRLWLWLRKYLEWQNVKTLEIKERVGLKIEFIKTAAQILGGIVFLVTIYVAWQNLVLTQEKNRNDLFVAQEKQTTELYTRAIELLGSGKLEVRLGGIYALERIARDSEKDHGPIMEVLTAYVRLHAPWTPEKAAAAKEQQDKTKKRTPDEKKPETKPAPEVKPEADIQAILTVLGRRARTYGKGEADRLDLRQTDLRGADLNEAHLEGAFLNGAHLQWAKIGRAHLEGADLNEAHLKRVVLVGAYLGGANLVEAHLEDASFVEAHLEGANLVGAHLEKADLRMAHMEGAFLAAAHLEGAHLTGAIGLTQEQIASAIIDEKTKLPDHLKPADPDKAKPQ